MMGLMRSAAGRMGANLLGRGLQREVDEREYLGGCGERVEPRSGAAVHERGERRVPTDGRRRDEIVRGGGKVALGEAKTLGPEACLNLESYFREVE